MAGSYGHAKLQENISRYIKELESGLVQTSPRLTERKLNLTHRRTETQNVKMPKLSIVSKTPDPIRGKTKSEICKALEYIKKKEETQVYKKPIERQATFTVYLKEDPVIKQFVDSLFSSEPSAYKKSSFNSDMDNFDVVSADKILIEARKIIKSGVRKKKQSNQVQDDFEYFWKTHISKDKLVRWDIFEDNFITFISSYMITDLGIVRKVNWRKVLHKLYSKYSREITLNQNWLKSPSIEKLPQVVQRAISIQDLGKAFQSQDLTKFLLNSIDELLPDPIRHKEDKEFFYSCGCIYKGQWKEGKRDGAGLLKLCSQERYEGYFTKGLFHSYGILSYSSFSYKGFFKKDHFNGYGRLSYPNGSSFEGIFNKSLFSKGTLKFADGRIYNGEFLNQNFEGKGEMHTIMNEVHKGMWADGKLNGDCKITYSSGTTVSGVFINGVISSYGKLKTDSFKYSGQFDGNIPHGQGRYQYKTGIIYEGSVNNGTLEGIGVMTYPNGDSYEGEFVNGDIVGSGVLRYKDGKVYQGLVLDGKPNGLGIMTYAKGKIEKYEGNFENGEKEGIGKAWFINEAVYSGAWKSGKIEGEGKITSSLFDYEGEIANGRFHGFGSIKMSNGYYVGEWDKGKPDGQGEVQDDSKISYSGMFKEGFPVIKTKIDPLFLDKIGSIYLPTILI